MKSLAEIKKSPVTGKIQLAFVLILFALAWALNSMTLAYIAGLVGIISLIPFTGNRMVQSLYYLRDYLSVYARKSSLTVLYYLIITPLGFFYRLMGNDPLLVKDNKKSVYTFREQTFKKGDLEHPK